VPVDNDKPRHPSSTTLQIHNNGHSTVPNASQLTPGTTTHFLESSRQCRHHLVSPKSSKQSHGQWSPGVDSVPLQVIATTALPALARQAKEVEQRNPRKRNKACQSATTTAKRAAGNLDNEEQIATTSRKCNAVDEQRHQNGQ